MNYKKIYENFIIDRRNRESSIDGYYEKHHILPKSLGGTNEPDNLIKLSAGDHYFAHLLLAKIHGGKQWYGVHAMANLHMSKKRGKALAAFKSRKMVEVSRQHLAEAARMRVTGTQTRQHRPTIKLFNLDGRKFEGKSVEAVEQLGISFSAVSMLINRKRLVTKDGWYAYEGSQERLEQRRRNSGSFYKGHKAFNAKQVICVDTGEVFDNSTEAGESCGADSRNIRSVCRGERKTTAGFNWEYV